MLCYCTFVAAIVCLASPIVLRSAQNHVFFALLPGPRAATKVKKRGYLLIESASNTGVGNFLQCELGMSHKEFGEQNRVSVDTVMYGIRYMLLLDVGARFNLFRACACVQEKE